MSTESRGRSLVKAVYRTAGRSGPRRAKKGGRVLARAADEIEALERITSHCRCETATEHQDSVAAG